MSECVSCDRPAHETKIANAHTSHAHFSVGALYHYLKKAICERRMSNVYYVKKQVLQNCDLRVTHPGL
jgi:hypothetical protein